MWKIKKVAGPPMSNRPIAHLQKVPLLVVSEHDKDLFLIVLVKLCPYTVIESIQFVNVTHTDLACELHIDSGQHTVQCKTIHHALEHRLQFKIYIEHADVGISTGSLQIIAQIESIIGSVAGTWSAAVNADLNLPGPVAAESAQAHHIVKSKVVVSGVKMIHTAAAGKGIVADRRII